MDEDSNRATEVTDRLRAAKAHLQHGLRGEEDLRTAAIAAVQLLSHALDWSEADT